MPKGYRKQQQLKAVGARSSTVMSPGLGYATDNVNNRDPFSPPPTDGTRDLSGWRRAVAQWNELHDMAINSANDQRRKTALSLEERAPHLRMVLTGMARSRADNLTIAQLQEVIYYPQVAQQPGDRPVPTRPPTMTGLELLMNIVDPPNKLNRAMLRARLMSELFRLERSRIDSLHLFVQLFDAKTQEMAREGISLQPLDEVLGLRLLDAANLKPEESNTVLFTAMQACGDTEAVCTLKAMEDALFSMREQVHDVVSFATETKGPCPACKRTDHWSPRYKKCPKNQKAKKDKQGTTPDDVSAEPAPNSEASARITSKLLTSHPSDVTIADSATTVAINHTHALVDTGAVKSTMGRVQAARIGASILPLRNEDPQLHRFGSGPSAGVATRIIGRVWIPVTPSIDVEFFVTDGSSPCIIGNDVLQHARLQDRMVYLEGELLQTETIGDLQYVKLPKYTISYASIIGLDPADAVRRLHARTHHRISDIETILLRAGEISAPLEPEIRDQLEKEVAECPACFRTMLPQANRKASFSPVVSHFGERVSMDVVHLKCGVQTKPVLHVVDDATAYSEVFPLKSLHDSSVVHGLAVAWVDRHGPPAILKADAAFAGKRVQAYSSASDIQLAIMPARRHQKMGIVERKNREIRKYYHRLQESISASHREASFAGHISRAAFLSNIAYGDRLASSFEMARGYTPFIGRDGLYPPLQPEVRRRESKRLARRRLLAVRQSPSLNQADALNLVPGEAVYFFLNDKGKHKTPNAWRRATVEAADGTGVHLMDRGNRRFVALEDVKRAPRFQPFSSRSYRDDDTSSDTSTADGSSPSESSLSDQDESFDQEVENLATRYDRDFQKQDPSGTKRTREELPNDDEQLSAEDEFQVVRRSVRPRRATQRLIETMMAPSTAEFSRLLMLFGNKTFGHNAAMNSGCSPAIFEAALKTELSKWKDQYIVLTRQDVPATANVIGSHVLYQMKNTDPVSSDDEAQFKLKARLCLWGHRDQDKDAIRGDAPTPQLVAVRLVLALAAVFSDLTLAKIDVTGAYLQSGPMDREVYVRPPHYLNEGDVLWKLIVKPYGLKDAGRQWLLRSDAEIVRLGLVQSKLLPQIFYGEVIVVKYVDDLLVLGEPRTAELFLTRFAKRFRSSQPVTNRFSYIGCDVARSDNGVFIDVSRYAEKIHCAFIPRGQDTVPPSAVNYNQRLAGSINWLGLTVSPFASFTASYIQQLLSSLSVQVLRDISGITKELLRTPARLFYPAAFQFASAQLLVYSDAGFPFGKNVAYSQAAWLLLLTDDQGKALLLDWESSKSKRVTYSTLHAEVRALVAGMEHALHLKRFFAEAFERDFNVILRTDSKGTVDHLLTSNAPKLPFLVPDITAIRDAVISDGVRIEWVKGGNNLADPATKRGALQTTALLADLMLQGILPSLPGRGVSTPDALSSDQRVPVDKQDTDPSETKEKLTT